MTSETRITQAIQTAHQDDKQLHIVGAKQHLPTDMYNQTGIALDMTAHTGVVDYVPDDLVITVKAGTTLAEIQHTIAHHRQTVPLIAPNQRATIGGLLACGRAGHGMPFIGSMRNLLLGVRLLDGQGRVLNFGGTVVKNVAGYDVSRLQIGAWGAFGVLCEVSLKLVPENETTVDMAIEDVEPNKAMSQMQTFARQYLPIAAMSYEHSTIMIRLSGSKEAVAHAQTCVGGKVASFDWNMQQWLDDMKQYHHNPLWAWMVSHDVPVVDGTLRLDWAGNKRWMSLDPQAMQQLIDTRGGYTLYDPNTLMPGQKLPQTIKQQLVRLKTVFDPHMRINRSLFERFVAPST